MTIPDPAALIALKTCSKCHVSKPLTEFGPRRKESRDGYNGRCQACIRESDRVRYRDLVRRVERRHYLRKHYATSRTYNKLPYRPTTESKRRTAAIRAVQYALRTGSLVRPKHCSRCGSDQGRPRIEAHHSDYSRRLDVIWLCRPCHSAVHIEMRDAALREMAS